MGGNKHYKLNESIKLMEKHIRKEAKCNYKEFYKADMKAAWVDIEKAKRLLDWQPHVILEEGIKSTVGWTKDNWEWAKEYKN